jgi:protein SCO1/2
MNKKSTFIFLIFGIPFLLGIGILGYWYLTMQVEKQVLLPSYGTAPDFSLVSEDHQDISRNNLMTKVSIIDFIFTECAGTCPMMSSKMSELQTSLSNDPHVQFISFSVDPETDTPEVLSEYAKQYNAKKGTWIFLTGNKQSIYDLTKQGFHLGLDIEGDNAIIHSQKFVLVDSHAVIRGYYDSEDEEAMKNLIRDARILANN